MRGEIADFKESLRRRVALLEGVPVSALQQVSTSGCSSTPARANLSPPAQAAGLKTLLVSGGFTFFSDRVRERLGIDFARANVLDDRRRRAHRPRGAAALGRHLRRRRKAPDAAGDLRRCWACAGAGDRGGRRRQRPADDGRGRPVGRVPRQAEVREQAMVAINEGGLDRLLELLR